MGVLTGDATQAEAVAAVRGDRHLDDLVGQAQQLDRVVPGGQLGRVLLAEQRLQDDDAVVILTETELSG